MQQELIQQSKQIDQTLLNIKQLEQYRQQLQRINQKLNNLQNQSYFISNSIQKQINWLLQSIDFKKLSNSFERKFCQQIKLLKDFYQHRHRQSFFNCFFFLCPGFAFDKFKLYTLTDSTYQFAISDISPTTRNIFFYINLLYIKLYLMYQLVDEQIKLITNHLITYAIQLKAFNIIFQRGLKKLKQKKQKTIESKQYEETEFNSIQSKSSNIDDIKQTNLQQFQVRQNQKKNTIQQKIIKYRKSLIGLEKIKAQIQQVIMNDRKKLQKSQQGHIFEGFIQVNDKPYIKTTLQLKNCKLKTDHFFSKISSRSFDLRGFLVRKSRKIEKGFVLNAIYSQNLDCTLRFYPIVQTQTKKNQQNYAKIQQFFMFSMRVGIKQKIVRMAKNKICKQMFSYDTTNQKELQKFTSFHSISDKSAMEITFWWAQLGEKLIKSIIQVARQKIQAIKIQKKKILKNLINNPQADQYLNQSTRPMVFDYTKQNKKYQP